MGEGQKKRNRAEKEALRLLKKLRRDAHKAEEQRKETAHPRPVYGPPRPPSLPIDASTKPEPDIIGPEIPDFLKAKLSDATWEEAASELEQPTGDVMGPLPPEDWGQATVVGRQMSRKNGDEIERILKCLREDEALTNPYAILGISNKDASDVTVKKAYWKCSLLVHPDKNAHPQAQKAFQVLNRAWKEVQSIDKRLTVQKKQEDAELKQQAEREIKKAQRQQEWMHVLHPGTKPQGSDGRREAWMTELPELRRKPAIAKQIHQTSFSRKPYVDVSRGASQWQRMPKGDVPSGRSIDESKQREAPVARQASKVGRSSLLERHRAERASTPKAAKAAKSKSMNKAFEYRPFDREKDLEMKRGNDDGFLKNIGSLGSRFG